MKIEVLYEESDHFVLDKPSRFHTVKGKSEAKSIEDWLSEHRATQKLLPECGVVHRLDYETSGCLLVAKSKEAYERFIESIRSEGEIAKTYLVFLSQQGLKTTGEFSLFFSSRYRGSKKVTVSEKGKETEKGTCRWKQLSNDIFEVELVGPGKRHQIRAGFSYLGYPLLGDTLYGAPAAERLGLHAWKLKIEGREITSPPPWKLSI